MQTTFKSKAKSISPLDSISMTEIERRNAETCLRRGEQVAAFLVWAAAGIGSFVRRIERSLVALVRVRSVN